MKVQVLVGVVLLALGNCFSIANAHHSTVATFTDERTSTIEGVVTDFRFRNPHVLIYLDVTNEDGTVTNWMVEGRAATGWRRANWKNDSLKKGDMMRISGDATFDGSPMIWLKSMEMLDKETKAVIAKLEPNKDPLVSLSGQDVSTEAKTETTAVIKFLPARLISGDPNFTGTTRLAPALKPWKGGPDGNDDPVLYNETGKAAAANWDIKNDPQVFCDPPGLVRQAGFTPYGLIIKQYHDLVTIEYEEYGNKRAIFLEDKLPRSGFPTRMGDSVARYEGDTLVIETVNLLSNASGHRGNPFSDKATVKEVYSRSNNPDFGTVLKIVTTVDDPEYLSEPWTVERVSVYDSDYSFLENECVPPKRPRPANVWQEYKQ